MKSGIYKITSPTGRVYVGQAMDVEDRKKEYSILRNCIQQKRLYSSFLKYGWGAHIFETIEKCNISELNSRERFWQEHFDVIGKNGMNCVLQNSEEKRKVYSEKVLKKMSISKRGINNPMFGRRGEDSPIFGIKRSENTKNKISLINTGEKHPMFGKLHSEKSKKSMSISRSGSNNYESRKVIDLGSGIIYVSIREASECNGIKYNTLRDYLNGRLKNKTNLRLISENT